MLVGCALGLTVTAIMAGLSVFLVIKSAKTRFRVWWGFGFMFAFLLGLGIIGVHEFPYALARPGSDYEVVLVNMFLQGFGYCACPGPAALLAALGTWLMPRHTANAAK